MKFRTKDIEGRETFTLDKSVHIGNSIGYIKFGEDNAYPDKIENLILGSPTAKACAGIMARFITGLGFHTASLNEFVVSKTITGKPVKLIDMLRKVAYSVAFHNGFYVLVMPDLTGTIRDTQFIPFKNARFSKPDDKGYSAYVGVYDNWAKNPDKKFDKEKVKDYYVFNLNEKIIAEQAKGNPHKGQIYHCFIDQNFIYPLSPFDASYLDMDTEQELSKHQNNEVRNGFTKKTLLFTPEFDTEEDALAFDKRIQKFMGTSSAKTMCIEAEFDEKGEVKAGSGIVTKELSGNIDDKLYDSWDKKLYNNIRKCANAIPSVFLDYDESKLGTTSGESIIQATNFYNAMTHDIREAVSLAFKDVYSNFADIPKDADFTIEKLKLYENATVMGSTAIHKANIGQ